jgi:hypothetical protein
VGAKYLRNITKILKSASGVLYGRVTAGTGRGEELSPSQVRTLIGFDESVDDRVSALLAAGTNITITYNDAANTLTIASTAGGLSGTGSVDNAVLRADGTGGATLQNSAWIIADNATASPNNTVNHASIQATGGTTNVSVSIVPKGTGAFCLAAPNAAASGGNVRGVNSIDLQTARSTAAQVASGDYATLLGGQNNSCPALYGVICGGQSNTATGNRAIVVGAFLGSATGDYATIIGGSSQTASGRGAFIGAGEENSVTNAYGSIVGGLQGVSDRYAQRSYAAGYFVVSGDAQWVAFQSRNRTTSAVATELFLNGVASRLTIPNGKILSALVRVVGVRSDGSEIIKFLRDVTIKNVGGTTSLEAAVVTIGTDINVSGATLDLSADNTNDCLRIAVTPPSGTWRWHAIVEVANEIAFGT